MERVRDLMSREVVTLRRNDALSAVDHVMEARRIRHMPILDDQDAVVGIVSQRDVFFNALVRALGFGAAASGKVLDALLVKEIMTTDVVTTTPDTPLRQAAELMCDRKIGCLPVIDDGSLVGILTEGDFVAAAAH